MNRDPSTFAVLTRGMLDETPFLKEFVQHYLNIGFDRVYFVNTDTQRGYVADCLGPDLAERVTVIDASNQGLDWQEKVLNDAVVSIRESWILGVDVDEFLFLHGQTIHDIVSRCPADSSRLHFRWALSLSTRYAESSVVDLLDSPLRMSRTVKTMSRRSRLRRMTVHDSEVSDGRSVDITTDYATDPFIVHFACRGILDLMARVVGRNYGNAKSGPAEVETLRRLIDQPAVRRPPLPFRFHIYRVQKTTPPLPLRLSRDTFGPYDGIDVERALHVSRSTMRSLGWNVCVNDIEELGRSLEASCLLRARLLRDPPHSRFIRLHLESGEHYETVTHAYLRTFRP